MYKILYNIKTGKRYKTERILVLGSYEQGLAAVTEFGFLPSMVTDREADPGPTFFCSPVVPKDWPGAIVPAERFAEVMTGRESKARSSLSGIPTARPPAPPPKPTRCKYADPGDPVDPSRPCLGRKVVCRHPDNTGMIRRGIECRPPDPERDYIYNVRSCTLFEAG